MLLLASTLYSVAGHLNCFTFALFIVHVHCFLRWGESIVTERKVAKLQFLPQVSFAIIFCMGRRCHGFQFFLGLCVVQEIGRKHLLQGDSIEEVRQIVVLASMCPSVSWFVW